MLVAGQLVDDLEALPEDLEKFSIRDTKCYCCTHNHVNPETGQSIPCDRKLVFKTLVQWLGKGQDTFDPGSASEQRSPNSRSIMLDTCDEESLLDSFDSLVKTRVGPSFLYAIRGSRLLYVLTLSTVGAVDLCWAISSFVPILGCDTVAAVRLLAEVLQRVFFQAPVTCRGFLWFASVGKSTTQRLPRWLDALGRCTLYMALLVFCYLALAWSRRERSVMPQVAVFVAFAMVVVAMYQPSRWGTRLNQDAFPTETADTGDGTTTSSSKPSSIYC